MRYPNFRNLLLYLIGFTFIACWGFNFASATAFQTLNTGINSLFWYRQSNYDVSDSSTTRQGLDIREAEINFYSDVDPYTKLNMILSLHPEYTYNSNTHKIDSNYKIEPEELYAESLSFIPDFGFKLGKFKLPFGVQNTVHTHAYMLMEQPLINKYLLGEEGLNEVSAQISYLLPLSWFSSLDINYSKSPMESQAFNSQKNGEGMGLVHFKNLWDLNEDLSLELGLSYANGQNHLKSNTQLWDIDWAIKWRPSTLSKYHSLSLGGEYMRRQKAQATSSIEKGSGTQTFLRYQWVQRWQLNYRFDYFEMRDSDSSINSESIVNGVYRKNALALDFLASEFSQFKFEVSQYVFPLSEFENFTENRYILQANFTIGAHPSHTY